MDKKKMLKIIIIIILVVLLLLIIQAVRNYVIIKNVNKKIEETQKSTNYSYAIELDNSSNNKDLKKEFYYKDGVEVVKTISEGEVRTLDWSNYNTKEEIYIHYENKTVRIDNPSSGSYSIHSMGPFKINFMDLLKKYIPSKEINGQKCYKLGDFSINKENGTLVKVEFENEAWNYTDWKFNQVTDEDVAKPDISGFEVTTKREV